MALCKGRSLQLVVSIPCPFSPEEMIQHHMASLTLAGQRRIEALLYSSAIKSCPFYLRLEVCFAVPMLPHGFWLILHIF